MLRTDSNTEIVIVEEGHLLHLIQLLKVTHVEMKAFSSKKQDGVVNISIVKNINRLIGTARKQLLSEPTIEYLEVLDEYILPSNSYVVIVLSLYIEALNLKHKNEELSDANGGSGLSDVSGLDFDKLLRIEEIMTGRPPSDEE